jgi:hypothetical protein
MFERGSTPVSSEWNMAQKAQEEVFELFKNAYLQQSSCSNFIGEGGVTEALKEHLDNFTGALINILTKFYPCLSRKDREEYNDLLNTIEYELMLLADKPNLKEEDFERLLTIKRILVELLRKFEFKRMQLNLTFPFHVVKEDTTKEDLKDMLES